MSREGAGAFLAISGPSRTTFLPCLICCFSFAMSSSMRHALVFRSCAKPVAATARLGSVDRSSAVLQLK